MEELGPPAAIRYGELPDPVPGPGEVLVRVAATTANPVDTLVRSGRYPTGLRFPLAVGRDVAGTVVTAAAGFAAGEAVWCNSLGHGGRPGAAAELAAVPADRLYRLPAGVDPVDAVAVVHPAGTAYLALHTHGRLRAGETVLVGGAAGNVGGALVTLAVAAGARVLATCRPSDAAHCRALGASSVLDYADPSLAGRVRELAPAGVDVVVDTSGHNDLETAVDLLARRGRIVVLAGGASRPVLPAGRLYLKDGAVLGFIISTATVGELAEAAECINGLLADGRLRARSIERLPLAATAETHRRLEAGELHGRRVVLIP